MTSTPSMDNQTSSQRPSHTTYKWVEDHWRMLVRRYADGRSICNCSEAYYSENGEYYLNGEKKTDGKFCRHGCQANQWSAKYDIARRICEEFGIDEDGIR